MALEKNYLSCPPWGGGGEGPQGEGAFFFYKVPNTWGKQSCKTKSVKLFLRKKLLAKNATKQCKVQYFTETAHRPVLSIGCNALLSGCPS